MSKAPAFQLYAADFYMDTVGWTATEVGAYFRLLLHEWVNGPLPDNIGSLARIAGIDHKTMGKFWLLSVGKKFVQNDQASWENSRLEQTRKEQQEYVAQQAISGQKGGLKAQELRRSPSSKPSSKPSSEIEALQSSSSSSIKKTKDNGFVLPDDIDPELWKDFKELRIKKKAPLTDRACRLIVNELIKIGQDKNRVIEQSIMKGWTGVFEIKTSPSTSTKSIMSNGREIDVNWDKIERGET